MKRPFAVEEAARATPPRAPKRPPPLPGPADASLEARESRAGAAAKLGRGGRATAAADAEPARRGGRRRGGRALGWRTRAPPPSRARGAAAGISREDLALARALRC